MLLTFFKIIFFEKKNSRTLSVSNGLDPDQDGHSVSPDLSPNCLQRLSADMQHKLPVSKERVNALQTVLTQIRFDNVLNPICY